MEKNENKKIIDFYNLKQQKIFELQKKKDKSKSVSERKEKVDRNFKELVVHTKESENRKKRKRKSKNSDRALQHQRCQYSRKLRFYRLYRRLHVLGSHPCTGNHRKHAKPYQSGRLQPYRCRYVHTGSTMPGSILFYFR